MSAEMPGFGQRLRALAALFLRLGVIGFGGPLAHIGLMEDHCVTRRQWATRQQFLEGLAICNLLPGPTSTQLSIYLGYLRAGTLGGLVSGACFIFPAFVLVLLLAWAYVQYGSLPQVGALFVAIGPVVIGIIVNTVYRTSKTALTNLATWIIALIACALVVKPLLPPSVNLLTILLASGLVGVLLFRRSFQRQAAAAKEELVTPPPKAPKTDSSLKSVIAAPLLGAKTFAAAAAPTVGLLTVALVFFKIGLLMFGGGLVVAPLLQQELVDGPHWLTTRQLVDGLALGQLTPGPVTTVATFAGYAVAGFPGGVVATIAVFAPSFILVLSLTPLLLRVRSAPIAKAFLKGITAGALGAIAAAAILFGLAAIKDVFTAAIAFVSLALLLRWNVNTVFLIGGAALLGLGRALLHI
jgi:chromate transporter